jgi:ATP-dependent RNA helicase RhlE
VSITFESMGLNKALLQALASTGYVKPTPIQEKAIPDVMAGKDLLGIAQTGTGKTAAFALPILHRLAANRVAPKPRTTRCLILSPTRELATQIGEMFKIYGAGLGMRVAVVFSVEPSGAAVTSPPVTADGDVGPLAGLLHAAIVAPPATSTIPNHARTRETPE